MAQKKTGSSARSGAAGKSSSASRSTGGTKKKTTASSKSASSKSASRSSSAGGGSRSAASRSGAGKNQSAARTRKRRRTRPIRREVGGVVLLFLGIVAAIALFPTEGWLVDAWRGLCSGLFGWGYYIAPPLLLWSSYILLFHRGRPVASRVTCVLLLGLVMGAFVHMLWYERTIFVSGFFNGIADLWDDGRLLTERCGGVLSGLLGTGLRLALSKYGAFVVLVAAFLLMAIEGMDLSLPGIIESIAAWYRSRPKLFYEPEEDEEYQDDIIDDDERLDPEDFLFPLDGLSPIRQARQRIMENRRARYDRKKAAAEAKKAAKASQRENRARPARFYDENWEEWKDQLFAAMDVDEEAKKRVAAALEEEQRLKWVRQTAIDAAARKAAREAAEKAEREAAEAAAREAAEKAAREKAAKAAREEKSVQEEKSVPKDNIIPLRQTGENARTGGEARTQDVEPISVEAAAQIAGVELNSADMDGGAASPAPAAPAKKEKIDKDAEAALMAAEIEAASDEERPEYLFPSISLLNKSRPGEGEDSSTDDGEAQLEAAIRSYGVGATITGAVRGPSITRYELKLDQGVKLSKIENLGKDIALSLGVESVRIAPIPDKISTVGVEVPNRTRTTVWLGDLIDSDVFRSSKSKLSVAMGKDIAGNVIVGNIAKMPHVLIAGTTGSGKSVCVNSMILSLLYKSTPDEVRMIMIDPKMVEFVVYNGMPHLYVPVVTDPKKAAGALQWAVVEMLKRYSLFSEAGVRDLAGYNTVLKNNGEQPLPQVVIFIDELADLMMIAAKEVEESICRVAQMGRAAGMHLVVATQSPRADVITGLMKANIPSRIALSVASSLESRIILDQQGAESLVGNGDMLFAPIGRKPTRVQGAFVTDEEREEIIRFVKQSAEATYSDEILEAIDKAAEKSGKDDAAEKEESAPQNDYDELLPQAVEVIFETKQASVSMLQRRLKLGYSRAARLIDQLEEVGVVGPYEGSKPRKILLTKQQWQEMQYAQGTAPVDTIADEFSRLSDDDTFAQPEEEEEDDVIASAPAPADADSAGGEET